ncbi:hypothetical protein M9434_003387 [Picochlorum sp. BPE23]|nr:hypothetical protein M9434_003387 [Picochlorum sp. BPE23]
MNPEKLSVLMVSHEMTPTGAVLSLLNLYHGLSARGHAVDMISLDGGYLASTFEQVDTSFNWNQSSPSSSMENGPEMYDAIVANTIASDAWLDTQYKAFGPIFSDRLLWFIRELPLDLESQARYLYESLPSRKSLMQLAHSVLFVSRSSKALYEGHYDLSPRFKQSLRVVNNALNADLNSILPCMHQFRLRDTLTALSKVALRIPIDQIAIVSTGKFSQQKGSYETMKDFLFYAFSRDKRSNQDEFKHIIFVGDVEKTYWKVLRKQYLESRRTRNGMVSHQTKLHLVGSITSTKAMREYYNVASIILLHSKCEAFGRVILEAFAHGVPVVATGCGGPAEIIKHGKTGFLFSTDAELMWNVDHLINNPEIAVLISKRSCDLVRSKFSSTSYMTTMENILRDIALKASGPR